MRLNSKMSDNFNQNFSLFTKKIESQLISFGRSRVWWYSAKTYQDYFTQWVATTAEAKNDVANQILDYQQLPWYKKFWRWLWNDDHIVTKQRVVTSWNVVQSLKGWLSNVSREDVSSISSLHKMLTAQRIVSSSIPKRLLHIINMIKQEVRKFIQPTQKKQTMNITRQLHGNLGEAARKLRRDATPKNQAKVVLFLQTFIDHTKKLALFSVRESEEKFFSHSESKIIDCNRLRQAIEQYRKDYCEFIRSLNSHKKILPLIPSFEQALLSISAPLLGHISEFDTICSSKDKMSIEDLLECEAENAISSATTLAQRVSNRIDMMRNIAKDPSFLRAQVEKFVFVCIVLKLDWQSPKVNYAILQAEHSKIEERIITPQYHDYKNFLDIFASTLINMKKIPGLFWQFTILEYAEEYKKIASDNTVLKMQEIVQNSLSLSALYYIEQYKTIIKTYAAVSAKLGILDWKTANWVSLKIKFDELMRVLNTRYIFQHHVNLPIQLLDKQKLIEQVSNHLEYYVKALLEYLKPYPDSPEQFIPKLSLYMDKKALLTFTQQVERYFNQELDQYQKTTHLAHQALRCHHDNLDRQRSLVSFRAPFDSHFYWLYNQIEKHEQEHIIIIKWFCALNISLDELDERTIEHTIHQSYRKIQLAFHPDKVQLEQAEAVERKINPDKKMVKPLYHSVYYFYKGFYDEFMPVFIKHRWLYTRENAIYLKSLTLTKLFEWDTCNYYKMLEACKSICGIQIERGQHAKRKEEILQTIDKYKIELYQEQILCNEAINALINKAKSDKSISNICQKLQKILNQVLDKLILQFQDYEVILRKVLIGTPLKALTKSPEKDISLGYVKKRFSIITSTLQKLEEEVRMNETASMKKLIENFISFLLEFSNPSHKSVNNIFYNKNTLSPTPTTNNTTRETQELRNGISSIIMRLP
jgi:hypothetical protein